MRTRSRGAGNIWRGRVPRHFGKFGQPQNLCPAFAPRFASRRKPNNNSTGLNSRVYLARLCADSRMRSPVCPNGPKNEQEAVFQLFASQLAASLTTDHGAGLNLPLTCHPSPITFLPFPNLQNMPATGLRGKRGRTRLTNRRPACALMISINDLVDPEYRFPFIGAIGLQ